jgi:hypothetical protein
MHTHHVNLHGYVLEVSHEHDACKKCSDLADSLLKSTNLHVVMLLNETADGHAVRIKRVGVDAWGGTSHRFITNTEGK